VAGALEFPRVPLPPPSLPPSLPPRRDVLEPPSVASACNQRRLELPIMLPSLPPIALFFARSPSPRRKAARARAQSFIYLAGQEAVNSAGTPAVTN